jgi:hypothetical protein
MLGVLWSATRGKPLLHTLLDMNNIGLEQW